LIMINFPPSFSDHSSRGRYGQYFHYLAKRLFALGRLKGDYRERAIGLACDVHRAFVIPSTSAIWKMGFGLGALDALDGYEVYRLLDEEVTRA